MRQFLFQNSDLQVSRASGQFLTTSGKEMLRQDVRLALDGAGLDALLGEPMSPPALTAEVSRRLRATLESIQRVQQTTARAYRTPAEILARIDRIHVQPLKAQGRVQKRAVKFRVDVQSLAGLEANLQLILVA